MTWKQKGLGLIVGGIGLLLVAGLGMYGYVLATMTPLHPSPQEVSSVTHQPPPQKWSAAVEQARQIVRTSAAEQNIPGVSVAVGIGGDMIWAEGFGWANLENKVPVAPDTLFRIGTASKVLTSAAVGVLLEKERLNLDDEIQAYVPGFPKKDWPVTLRQLMGHVAGVQNDAGDEEPISPREDAPQSLRCKRPVDWLERFADRPLLFEPGTDYRYSNFGWILVSAAVESAAQEPFGTFMRTQVFEPLGMNNTTADPSPEPSQDRARFYFPRFSADPRYGPDEGRELDYSCFSGSANVMSTPSDLVRFGNAINSGKLLKPETIQLLQTSQRLASGQETGYGLGWDVETADLAGQSRIVVGHDGELMGGMTSSFLIFREQGIVVAVTTNTSYADTAALALKVAQAFASPGSSPASK